jgi:hypothetical protein
LTSATAGAGAGVLTWAKNNWMLTTYPPTAPFVVAQPQSLTNSAGQSATFVVVAAGTGQLAYQWYFNTNIPVANATNSILTFSQLQTTNAGVYSVTVSNTAGATLSANASLVVVSVTPTRPQVSGSVYTNGAFSLTVNGDNGHDYIIQTSTNLTIWTSIITNPMPSLPFTWSDPEASNHQQFYRIQVGP